MRGCNLKQTRARAKLPLCSFSLGNKRAVCIHSAPAFPHTKAPALCENVFERDLHSFALFSLASFQRLSFTAGSWQHASTGNHLPTPIGMASTTLPFHLYEMYRSYKKATNTVIHWLSAVSSCEVPDITKLSLYSLLQLADKARDSKEQIPSDIAAAFRETIASRQHIGQYYHEHTNTDEDYQSYLRHEKFTETMQIAYGMLVAQPKQKTTKRPKSKTKTAVELPAQTQAKENLALSTTPSPNRFDALTTIMEQVEDRQQMSPPPTSPLEAKMNKTGLSKGVPAKSRKSVATKSSIFYNDPILDEQFESFAGACLALAVSFLDLSAPILLILSQRLDQTLAVVKEACSRAGKDQIPFSSASMTMVAAIHWSYRYTNYLEWHLDGIKNGLPLLQTMQFNKLQKWLKREMEFQLGGYAGCTFDLGLITPILSLLKIGPPRPPKLVPKSTPVNHLTAKSTHAPDLDLAYLEALRDIGQTYGFELQLDSGLLKIVSGWMEKIMTGQGTFDDAFGLRMLLEAQRSYVWSRVDELAEVKNPRLRVLQFADEAFACLGEVTISPWMEDCNCSFPKNLRTHYAGISTFCTSETYNMSTQNPLIAGCTLIELMAICKMIGDGFMSYCQHLPGLLHVYSIVRQNRRCSPVPMLENLCTILKKPVFLGERPYKNFATCFVRYLGGKLSFTKRKNASYGYGSNNKWQMKLPDNLFIHTDKCRKEANFKRFGDSVEVGRFWEAREEAKLRDAKYWSVVLTTLKHTSPAPNNLTEIQEWLDSFDSFSDCPLRLLHDVFLSELGCTPDSSLKDVDSVDFGPDEMWQALSSGHLAKPRNKASQDKPHVEEGFGCKAACCAYKLQGRDTLSKLPTANINWLNIWTECMKVVQEVREVAFHDELPLDPYDYVLMITDFVEAADHVCNNRGCACVKKGFSKDLNIWGEAFDHLAMLPLRTFVWKNI